METNLWRQKYNTPRWRQKYNGSWAPANPYANPESPESKAVRDGSGVPGLKPQSTTLSSYKKECRDGGKANKTEG